MDTSKTVFYKFGFILALTVTLTLPINVFGKDKTAASKALDLNIHYKYSVAQVENEQLLTPKPKALKKASKLGHVTEEKNTSSTPQKALSPYERTVSTGLSF